MGATLAHRHIASTGSEETGTRGRILRSQCMPSRFRKRPGPLSRSWIWKRTWRLHGMLSGRPLIQAGCFSTACKPRTDQALCRRDFSRILSIATRSSPHTFVLDLYLRPWRRTNLPSLPNGTMRKVVGNNGFTNPNCFGSIAFCSTFTICSALCWACTSDS